VVKGRSEASPGRVRVPSSEFRVAEQKLRSIKGCIESYGTNTRDHVIIYCS